MVMTRVVNFGSKIDDIILEKPHCQWNFFVSFLKEKFEKTVPHAPTSTKYFLWLVLILKVFCWMLISFWSHCSLWPDHGQPKSKDEIYPKTTFSKICFNVFSNLSKHNHSPCKIDYLDDQPGKAIIPFDENAPWPATYTKKVFSLRWHWHTYMTHLHLCHLLETVSHWTSWMPIKKFSMGHFLRRR